MLAQTDVPLRRHALLGSVVVMGALVAAILGGCAASPDGPVGKGGHNGPAVSVEEPSDNGASSDEQLPLKAYCQFELVPGETHVRATFEVVLVNVSDTTVRLKKTPFVGILAGWHDYESAAETYKSYLACLDADAAEGLSPLAREWIYPSGMDGLTQTWPDPDIGAKVVFGSHEMKPGASFIYRWHAQLAPPPKYSHRVPDQIEATTTVEWTGQDGQPREQEFKFVTCPAMWEWPF